MSDVSGRLFSGDMDTNISPLLPSGTGVFPSQALERLAQARVISSLQPIEADQYQPASLDLRLGKRAWRIDASFLPGPRGTVMERAEQLGGQEIDLSDGAVFHKKTVYLVELQEALVLPQDVYGVANPKSSTGRLDILTRLICDHATEFDRVAEGYRGRLYLEVAPLSFSVFARQGDRLNQLRIQRGKDLAVPQHKMRELYTAGYLTGGVDDPASLRNDELVPVTVDLRGDGRSAIVAYKARAAAGIIDLQRIGEYDPQLFWQPRYVDKGRLGLEENAFYILATRENVGVPNHLAAEMVPYDSRSGEFRVHYAGFFDPGFGLIDGLAKDSRAVLEVRSYGVPFTLEHGQIVGWLRYARIANGVAPSKLYGAGVRSHYQGQGLRLAKHFKQWQEPPQPLQKGPEDVLPLVRPQLI